MDLTTFKIRKRNTMINNVIHKLRYSMEMKTATIVTQEDSNCGKLWESI